MERKLSDSEFVPIPIRIIKSREGQHEKHKENIDKIMMRYITHQIGRDCVEV